MGLRGVAGIVRTWLALMSFGAILLIASGIARGSDQNPISGFPNTGAYSASFAKSSNGVAVVSLSGDYSRNLASGTFNVEPRTVVSKEFLKNFGDKYDFLLVFSSFEYNSGDAVAFYHGVRSNVLGIGVAPFDNSPYYGSSGKLQGFVDMDALGRYNLEPGNAQFESVLQVISHEFLHHWAAHVRFKAADGSLSNALIGRENAHWSFLMDSGGSVEYGNRWQDNGDGTYTTLSTGQVYSPLDLYLMGMLKKEQVPPFYLINSQDVDPTRLPEAGVTVHGSKTPVTIDDIIAAEGERTPNADSAQKSFQFGVILLTRPGETVTDEQIQAVNRVRQTFLTRLTAMTAGEFVGSAGLEVKYADTASSPTLSNPVLKGGAASVSSATTWLKTAQSVEGAWQDNAGTQLRDTTLALSALTEQSGTDAVRAAAIAWLGKQSLQNTDYIARRALAIGSASAAQDSATLLSMQNADGGWGVAAGYLSNAIDTSWAVLALQSNNTASGASNLAQGMAFLAAQQNADGGWGNVAGGSSRVYASAISLRALGGSAQSDLLVRGSVFLKSHQNADGGFGDTVSTVHDTVNVIQALTQVGKLDAVDLSAAAAFLNATQRSDGSWDGSVYSTSLALQILGNPGGGNWALSDFQISPTTPRDGQRVTLSIKVWNKGTQATVATVLRFYDGNPSSGGKAIGSDIAIPKLSPGASVQVSTVWSTFGLSGTHSLYASVDPDGVGVEATRTDDLLKADIGVAAADGGVDLAVFSDGVLTSPERINHLPVTVGVTAQISNLGKTDAGTVKVRLVATDTGSVLDEKNVILLGRSTVPVTLTLAMDKPSLNRVTIVVDSQNLTPDIDRSNNSIALSIPVDSTVDVQTLAADIQVPGTSVSPILIGNDVTFNVKLSNNGTADSSPFTAVYTVSNGTESREIARPSLQLGAGQSNTYSLPWRVDLAGTLSLSVQLDPTGTLSETDRTNNTATSATFTATDANGINLATSYHDLSANPNPALEGHPVTLSGIVRNTGNQTAANIEVGFYDGDPAKGGTLIAPIQTIPSLDAGASVTVQATSAALSGTQEHLYFIVVDPAGKLTELSHDDNQAFISVDVTAMSDLSVGATDIVVTPDSPRAGDAVTLNVGITNAGVQDAGSFVVRLYVGSSAQGTQIGSDMPVAALAGQATTHLSFPVTLPTSGSTAQYTVVVDPLEQVQDKDRSNNTATKIISLQGGDAYVSEPYFSPNGDGIKDTTRFGFKLGANGPYHVQITNSDGTVVRTFSDALSGASGEVEWNGKNDQGSVVEDGAYIFSLEKLGSRAVIQKSVVVDTNNQPIFDAMGTPRGVFRNTSCSLPYDPAHIDNWNEFRFVADDGDSFPAGYDMQRLMSGHFSISSGVFSELPSHPDLTLPGESRLVDGSVYYYNGPGDPVVTRDGSRYVGHVYVEYPYDSNGYTNYSYGEELWLFDAKGNAVKRLLDNRPDFEGKRKYGGINPDISITENGDYVFVVVYAPLYWYKDSWGNLYESGRTYQLYKIPTAHPEEAYVVYDFNGTDFWRSSTNFFSPNRRYYLVNNYQSVDYRIIDTTTGEYIRIDKIIPDRKTYYYGKWSKDSRYVTIPSYNGIDTLVVFDVIEKKYLTVGKFYDQAADWLGDSHLLAVSWSLSPDEKYFVGVFNADTAELIQVDSGMPAADVEGAKSHLAFNYATAEFSATYKVNSNGGLVSKNIFISKEKQQDYEFSVGGFGPRDNFILMNSTHDTKNGGVCSLSSGDSSRPYSGNNLFVYSSLDNLTSDIKASRSVSGDTFKLKGTAADAHFSQYKLEYASTASPNDWHQIGVPVTTEVIDGGLAQWAPPAAGRYVVRLTAEDLAGNTKTASVQVSTYTTPMITDVYKNLDAISPNGDGVQDALQIHYHVLDPGNLSFQIFNSANQSVKLSEIALTTSGQDATFVWDGRDSNGQVVPDGSYRIKVLDYEFTFDVDNTPPALNVALSPRAATPPARTMAFDVTDARLQSVRYEVAEEGTSNWRVLSDYATNDFESYQAQNPKSKASFAASRELDISTYFMRHRVIATDKAGNSMTLEASPGPHELLLGGLSRIRLSASASSACQIFWPTNNPISIAPASQPALGETLVVMPSDELNQVGLQGRSANPEIDYRETEWQPIDSWALNNVKFLNRQAGDGYYKAISLAFEDLRPQSSLQHRQSVYLEYAETSSRPAKSDLDSIYWKTLQITPPDVEATDSNSNPNIPVDFVVSAASQDKRFYLVRLVTVDDDGSRTVSPAYSFFVSPPPAVLSCTGRSYWTIAPAQGEECGSTPKDAMTLGLDPIPGLDQLNPDYILVRRVMSDGSLELLAKLAYQKPFELGKSTQFYSFSVRDWPSGEQSLQIEYYKVGGLQDQMLIQETAKFVVDHEVPTVTLKSPVDGAKVCMSHLAYNNHQVNYLALDGKVTSNSLAGAHWQIEMQNAVSNWKRVEPLGDSFTLDLAQATVWQAVTATEPGGSVTQVQCTAMGNEHCRPVAPFQWSMAVDSSQAGTGLVSISNVGVDAIANLGIADITNGRNVPVGAHPNITRVYDEDTFTGDTGKLHGSLQLRVHAYGASGAQVCSVPITLDVDGRAEGVVTINRKLISPNADGVVDSATLTLTSQEDLKLTVRVYAGPLDNNGNPTTTNPVRTVLAGQLLGAGNTDIEWDGRDDSQTVLTDGIYSVVADMADDCDNSRRNAFEVTIDNTAPSIQLSSPLPADQIGTVVPVVGVIDDANSASYQISYATAADAASDRWLPLANGNAALGLSTEFLAWQSAGLESGDYVLRIRAQDAAGNVRDLQLPMSKPQPQQVLGDVSVAPDLFSPNGDGLLDSTRISYALQQDANVTVEILSADGATVLARLQDKIARKSGLQIIDWNGQNPLDGKALSDGNLIVRVTAETTTAPIQIQTQSVRVRLDATTPVITVVQPANGWATGVDPLQVTVQDPLLSTSEVYLSTGGINGPWQLAVHNEDAAAKSLSVNLADFAEGAYGIKIVARDQAQNAAQVVQALQIDKTVPKVTLSAPATGAYVSATNGNIVVQGSVDEKNLAQYRLVLDQGNAASQTELFRATSLPATSSLMSWDTRTTADGAYTLTLVADDLAGSTAKVSAAITLDNTPPIAALQSAGSPWYVSHGSTITGTATDVNLLNYKLEIASGADVASARWNELLTAASPVAAGGTLARLDALPEDGQALLRLTVTDKAGNISTAMASVVVDTTAPATPLNLKGQIQNRHDAVLSWDAVGDTDLAGYAVFRDGVRVNSDLLSQPSYTDASLTAGHYIYTVKAYDKAGNASAASVSLTLVVTTSQPVAAILTPAAGGYASGIQQIKGTASASSDFKEYRLYAGVGSSPTSWQLLRQSPAQVTVDVLGEWSTVSVVEGSIYTFKLESEDLSGNVVTALTTVTVDNRAPVAPIGLTASASGATVSLNWAANTETDLQGYILTRDEKIANSTGIVIGSLSPYAIAATTYADASVADGKHTYYVQAIDKAGNLSNASNAVQVSIDTRAPHMTIAAPVAGTAFEQSVYVVGASDDTDIASVQFQYRAVGASGWTNIGTPLTKSPWGLTWNASALALGSYQIQAIATDQAGQTDSAPTPITVKLSKFDASATTTLSGLANGSGAQLSWSNTDLANTAGYYVERQNTAGGWDRLTSSLVTVPTYTDSGLSDGSYRYRIQNVVDTAGTLGTLSNESVVQIFTPQLVQPYTPTTASRVDISGQTLAGLTVELLRAGNVIASAQSGSDGSYTLAAAPMVSGDNQLSLRARDVNGNISQSVATHVVSVAAPAAPSNVKVSVSQKTATVSWSSNTESNLAGYVIATDGDYGKLSAPSSQALTSSSYSDSYHVVSRAVDADAETAWEAAGTTGWLQVTFGGQFLLNSVTVQWQAGHIPELYVLEAYDGQVWVPLMKVQDSTLDTQVLKPVLSYYTDRYRIRSVEASTTPRILEISATQMSWQSAPTSKTVTGLTDGSHSFSVKAYNTYRLFSPATSVSSGVGDATGPMAAVLSAQVQGSNVVLSWTHDNPADVAQFQIWRNGNLLTSLGGQSYTDTLLPNGQYSYQIVALDQAGNSGNPSNTVVTNVDLSGIATVLSLTGVAPDKGGLVTLNWAVASGSVPTSYSVLRATQSGGVYSTIASGVSAGSYQDRGVTNGADYFYVVRAYDATGNLLAQSPEIAVHPRDIVAPAAPVFIYPTRAGVPYLSPSATAEVRGLAEPGAYVMLSEDGTALSPIATSTKGSLQADTTLTFAPYTYAVSSDGNYLIVGSGSALVRQNLVTGAQAQLSEGYDIGSIRFAAQTPIAAVGSLINSTRYLYVGDASSGSMTAIGLTPQRTSSFAISPDGSTVYVVGKNTAGTQALWAYAVASGNAVSLADNSSATIGNVLAASSDSARLAYTVGTHVRIMKLADGSVSDVDIGATAVALSWSADSTHLLAEVPNGTTSRIGSLALEGLAWTYLTDASADYAEPVAAPVGDGYLARKNGSSLVYRNLAGDEWTVADAISPSLPIRWPAAGIAYAGSATQVKNISGYVPPGLFIASGVSLHAGSNIVGAQAKDAYGNTGAAANTIELDVANTALPDLSVQTTDIVAVPAMPVVGQSVQIAVRVHNNGGDAQAVPLVLEVNGADGTTVASQTYTIDNIANGATETVLLNWTPATVGQFSIIATTNGSRSIREFNYTDDAAMRTLNISASGAPSVAVAVDAARYAMSSTVNGSVGLTNAGNTLDGVLKTVIEDEQGYLVATLPEQAVSQLAYGENRKLTFTWAVGATFAGTYKAVATLYDATGVVQANGQSSFIIDADRQLGVTLTSDHATYTQADIAQLRGAISYTTGNIALGDNAVATLILTDANGATITQKSQTLAGMLPADVASLNIDWNSAGATTGAYHAILTVRDDSLSLGQAQADFAVVAAQTTALAGKLRLANASPGTAEALSVSYTLQNTGSSDLSALAVSVRVVDPALVNAQVPGSGVLVDQSTNTDLLSGASTRNSLQLLSTSVWPVRSLLLVLQAQMPDGSTMVLDQVSVAVADRNAPAVAFQTPAADLSSNAYYNGNFIVQARDGETSVAKVELSLDGANWVSMTSYDPQQGSFVLARTGFIPQADGAYTVYARATDAVGNQSVPVERHLLIDTTAPVISITGVEQGGSYVVAVLPKISVTDVNPGTVVTTLDGAAYTAGTSISATGAHQLVVTATDKLGNSSTASASFILINTNLTGTLTLSSSTPNAQQNLVIEALAQNPALNPAISGVFKIQISNVADNSVVTSFSQDGTLDAGGSFTMVRSWPVTGVVGSRYLVQWSATIGGIDTEIARQTITVTANALPLTLNPSFRPVAKALVLARCPRASDDSSAWCVERTTQNYNPVYDPACDPLRVSLLSSELGQMGYDSLVVSDEDAFLKALRSGAYSLYWIDGNATGLDNVTVSELRAALQRGDGLLLDGLTDAMNQRLAALGGFDYQGRTTAKPGLQTLGMMFAAGNYPTLADRAVRLVPTTGLSQAVLTENGASTRYAAIVSNSVGHGQTISIGFDLAGLMLSGSDLARPRDLISQAATRLQRSYLPGRAVSGGLLTHRIDVGGNKGQSINLALSLPTGASLISSTPSATFKSDGSGNAVVWTVTLSADTQSFEAVIRLPEAAGNYVLNSTLSTVAKDGSVSFQKTAPQTVAVVAASTLLEESVQVLQSMTLDDASAQARLMALQQIGNARLLMAAGAWGDALRNLIGAQTYIQKINNSDASGVLDKVAATIAYVERKM